MMGLSEPRFMGFWDCLILLGGFYRPSRSARAPSRVCRSFRSVFAKHRVVSGVGVNGTGLCYRTHRGTALAKLSVS